MVGPLNLALGAALGVPGLKLLPEDDDQPSVPLPELENEQPEPEHETEAEPVRWQDLSAPYGHWYPADQNDS